jgi:hypothetical protein
MQWLFRPASLAVVSVALALSAVALMFWPRPPENHALPLKVAEGDQEIVWLYAATNTAPWERFVKAAETARDRLRSAATPLYLEIDEHNAFPLQTTAVPELGLSLQGVRGRLWVRWYKITSDLQQVDWVRALLNRRPVPLAIIGGSSSDLAIDLARRLKEETTQRGLTAAAPLLLLTLATADALPEETGAVEESLHAVYAGRTFRFCFTNRQMAEAVTDFIWSQQDLCPDADPLYITYWQDDPYSGDLNRRFLEALREPALRGAARDWASLAGCAVTGGPPLGAGNLWWDRFRLATPEAYRIPYSVGTFDHPNRWEVEEARDLIETKLSKYPDQQRPLLVVPAAAQPVRRFLRALIRFAPREAQRFVVATGDAITFNTVYRDRNVTWPIQDLPFPLVFFCHRSPVDESAGFRGQSRSRPSEEASPEGSHAGTEDLLLFVDIVETLVQAGFQDNHLITVADGLKRRLSEARWLEAAERVGFDENGQPLFDSAGDRHSGTGEHVVCLRPVTRGEEILPLAQLEVRPWQPNSASGQRWGKPRRLEVDYEGAAALDLEPSAANGTAPHLP